ncbi:sulfatase-like hydrolase/transferase [Allorhodopirellula heiligendammensis]|uniref:Arylsulfatase n=1 Tax=Allorhodopirellula heiligendammensis TaxID=2714739 RepID=A0A5C6BU23_9BACT|nr:sulfatase-like hydrolase/transferase [Allorhodopirellula heiligendammensis]TWU15740.1 Arylsulfatase [Allorhodopirellula heiligendammensis]
MKILLTLVATLFLTPLATVHAGTGSGQPSPQPNVLVIVTDDQGYGEMSCHGNPVLQTPHLDQLYSESIRFTDFHVAPMCTPTRGQLMTGVDALRNGAMNVSSGRTLLRRSFPTMGDLFAESGWSTGLFGKWHLGDAYPYRPQDRGFQESLWYPSSHIGSVPDTWNNDYFDDTYIRNGTRQSYTGYTTDVLFDEAMQWMKQEAGAERPFLCYLATATAHQPHYVPEQYLAPVQAALEAVADQLPVLEPAAKEQLVRFLAMCVNIDENMGRLEKFLEEQEIRENTVLIFMTDNGSTFGPKYFNAGMRGGKTTLWEGGHRVPCFVRWPGGGLRPAGDVDGLTEVQDLLPTLTDLMDIEVPAATKFDGISLAEVLRGRSEVPDERMLTINYSRMPFKTVRTTLRNPAVPRREGAAVLWKHWRLLHDNELYNLREDPLQQHNVINHHPQVVAKMRSHLNEWWGGVQAHANDFEPSLIGHDAQNPVQLTACEWADVFIDQQSQVRRGERKNGLWHIEVAAAGDYSFTLSRWPQESGLALNDGIGETRVTDGILSSGPAWDVASARIRVGDVERSTHVSAGARSVKFEMPLAAGRTTMQTWLSDGKGQEIGGAYYVTAERLEAASPVTLIFDTDMSGDCDDAGALGLLHALADRGECELLAVVTNRRDLSNASAAAVDAINTYYGRPEIAIGTDKQGPTALQRTSPYAAALRDEFPNDMVADDLAEDAFDTYCRTLTAQPDHSVTICSVGALSNLAELCRRKPDLVRQKVKQLVVMGGEFPTSTRREANIATHPEAAKFVAAHWPGSIVWHGFEVGNVLVTGAGLKQVSRKNPVRRAYELRPHAGRMSIDRGKPSYDQAAALFAVRGADPSHWETITGGQVVINDQGLTTWKKDADGKHTYVKIAGGPEQLAQVIESLMAASPQAVTAVPSKRE